MGRRLSNLAEVVDRGDDAASKQVVPEAIDHHARSQRIVRVGNIAGQPQPHRAGIVVGNLPERFQKTARDTVAWILVVAANQQRLIGPLHRARAPAGEE